MSTYSTIQTREHAVLGRLRDRYEQEGYSFFAYPPRDIVPSFLGDYQPDGIALRGDGGVVIEVSLNRSESKEERLSRIARLIEGHRGWTFEVLFDAEVSDQPRSVPPPSVSQLSSQLNQIEQLAGMGHHRAGFVLGWAALEAAARLFESGRGASSARSLGPHQIIDTLASYGYVDQESATNLRRLAVLRNAAVHGNFDLEITPDDFSILRDILGNLVIEAKNEH